MKIELQYFKDIYDEELAKDAIINDRCGGHKEDYLLLHILLKKYQPKTFFEIGTNVGFGTLIIKNALGEQSTVYSLDLPDSDAHLSKQHPISEGKTIGVGEECYRPYIQLWGDSRMYSYEVYPCEGYFVDGEHTFENVLHETESIVKLNPKIIIFHDSDILDVMEGIIGGMALQPYNLYRVWDTRILYALKQQK